MRVAVFDQPGNIPVDVWVKLQIAKLTQCLCSCVSLLTSKFVKFMVVGVSLQTFTNNTDCKCGPYPLAVAHIFLNLVIIFRSLLGELRRKPPLHTIQLPHAL